VAEKLCITIKFFNRFGMEPVTNLEDALDEEKKIQRLVKQDNAYWVVGEETNSKIKIEKSGSISVSSMDNDAKLTLAKNGMLFRVSYMHRLPFKKPQWVEVDENTDDKQIITESYSERFMVDTKKGSTYKKRT
jgi:hypothetical protein